MEQRRDEETPLLDLLLFPKLLHLPSGDSIALCTLVLLWFWSLFLIFQESSQDTLYRRDPLEHPILPSVTVLRALENTSSTEKDGRHRVHLTVEVVTPIDKLLLIFCPINLGDNFPLTLNLRRPLRGETLR